jgi:hypothetical protein
VEKCVAKIVERQKRSSREVVGHEPYEDGRRNLSPLDDSEFYEPRHDTSYVCQGHARQIGERGQRQLFGGANEHAENPALRVRDQRLDRPVEVHPQTISLIDEINLSSMSRTRSRAGWLPVAGKVTPGRVHGVARTQGGEVLGGSERTGQTLTTNQGGPQKLEA